MKAQVGRTYFMKPPRKGRARLPRYVLEVTATHVKSATVPELELSTWSEWQARSWFESNIEREVTK